MKRFLIVMSAVAGPTLLGVNAAQAAGGGCQCGAPVAYAPAPAGTTAQAQPTTGYRTYSYQPGMYQPAGGYRSYGRSQPGGFRDAGATIRGEY
jgi:hypothetical protein